MGVYLLAHATTRTKISSSPAQYYKAWKISRQYTCRRKISSWERTIAMRNERAAILRLLLLVRTTMHHPQPKTCPVCFNTCSWTTTTVVIVGTQSPVWSWILISHGGGSSHRSRLLQQQLLLHHEDNDPAAVLIYRQALHRLQELSFRPSIQAVPQFQRRR